MTRLSQEVPGLQPGTALVRGAPEWRYQARSLVPLLLAVVFSQVHAQAGVPPADTPPVKAARAPVTRAATGVPAVALWIDWRLQASEDAQATPAPGGAVVVGTKSPVPAGWTATRSTDAAPPPPVTSVRAQNGHEASWKLDTTRVRQDHDFVWTAQGQGIVSHDTVVHAARALRATPRWPGGDAPVTLDLEVSGQGEAPRASEPKSERDLGLKTTLSVAFDEWTTVARLGDEDVQVRVRRVR